jgi:hypothetical protein
MSLHSDYNAYSPDSLFSQQCSPDSVNMDYSEFTSEDLGRFNLNFPSIMSPPPSTDALNEGNSDESPAAAETQSATDKKEADGKKQTKKRKSWGQVLPEPTTNLPPRYI